MNARPGASGRCSARTNSPACARCSNLRFDLGERPVAHRPRQGIAQQVAFINDGFALERPLLGKGHGGARGRRRRLGLAVMRAGLRRVHHARWLVSEVLRHLAMLFQHLVGREIPFGLARLMRGDLRGRRAALVGS